jgi:hypothetical protein
VSGSSWAGRSTTSSPTPRSRTKPGALADYFRAKADVTDMRAAFGELDPIATRPEYRDRDARLAVMDDQGIEACIMYAP